MNRFRSDVTVWCSWPDKHIPRGGIGRPSDREVRDWEEGRRRARHRWLNQGPEKHREHWNEDWKVIDHEVRWLQLGSELTEPWPSRV